MGYRISWIGTQAPILDILSAIDAVETGSSAEFPDFEYCVVSLEGGWTVVWAPEEFFNNQRCKALSATHPIIAVSVNETVMYSDARWFENGELVWSIWHQGDEDRSHLESSGPVPDIGKTIERAKRVEQAEDDASEPEYSVDVIFEIPLALAATYCPFKHDEFEGDKGACKELRLKTTPQRRGFLQRLFGG